MELFYDGLIDETEVINRLRYEKLRVLLDYMKQIKYHVIETDQDIVATEKGIAASSPFSMEMVVKYYG